MGAGGSVRLAEVVGSLSLATDLGTGQPMEHALRTCWLSLSTAEALGAGSAELSTVYYVALLRFLGCTADASETAASVGGDEIAYNASMGPMLMAGSGEQLAHFVRHSRRGPAARPPVAAIARSVADPAAGARSLAAHCEVAARLARRLGLPSDVTDALAHAYERWDGKGSPSGLAGDEVPFAIRVVAVARDVELWSRRGRPGGGHHHAAATAGSCLRPCRGRRAAGADALSARRDGRPRPLEHVLAAEPGPARVIQPDGLDAALEAVADFGDLRSRWFRGHSRAVSALASAAAEVQGLAATDVAVVGRAGLVHDLGAVGVPAGIWDSPRALSSSEWERVRLHPYLTERILARCGGLADVAATAAAHHERADGRGYPKGVAPSMPAQLLAAADVYTALREDRPHRAALTEGEARRLLVEEADTGRLDLRAVDAVLAAAGHRVPPPSVARPAGLTEREVDVLRLAARGYTNRASPPGSASRPRRSDTTSSTSTPRPASRRAGATFSPSSTASWTADLAGTGHGANARWQIACAAHALAHEPARRCHAMARRPIPGGR